MIAVPFGRADDSRIVSLWGTYCAVGEGRRNLFLTMRCLSIWSAMYPDDLQRIVGHFGLTPAGHPYLFRWRAEYP